MASPKPSLDTLPPELLNHILSHLVPTNLTIRLRSIKANDPLRPKLSAQEHFHKYESWYDDLCPDAEPPPLDSWPEEWVLESTLISYMPAEQGNGRYGLTAPPHPHALSPVITRREAMHEAMRQKCVNEETGEFELFSSPCKVVEGEDLDALDARVVMSRSMEGQGCGSGITSFMLLNRALCGLAREALYGTNTFSIPKVETLRRFVSNLSSDARQMVRRIAINACGRASYFATHDHQDWRFEMEVPGMDLFYPLSRFDGLREVVLAGIGPGVRTQVEWRDISGTADIPQEYEDGDQWQLKCIDLVARLVGVDVGDKRDKERRTTHSLFGGTVMCQKQDGVDNMCGSLRLLGTRIVARDAEYILVDNERVVDVAAALEQARQAKAEDERWRDRRNIHRAR